MRKFRLTVIRWKCLVSLDCLRANIVSIKFIHFITVRRSGERKMENYFGAFMLVLYDWNFSIQMTLLRIKTD